MGVLFPLVDASEYCRQENIPQAALMKPQCVLHFFLLPFVMIALIIEIKEEDHEGDAVDEYQRVHGVGEVAVCEQVVARVQEEQHELHL